MSLSLVSVSKAPSDERSRNILMPCYLFFSFFICLSVCLPVGQSLSVSLFLHTHFYPAFISPPFIFLPVRLISSAPPPFILCLILLIFASVHSLLRNLWFSFLFLVGWLLFLLLLLLFFLSGLNLPPHNMLYLSSPTL